MKEHISQSPIKDKRLILMLERYQHILTMRNYENYQQIELQFILPSPQYFMMMRLSQISLAHSFLSGQPEQFLEELNKDVRFWKMIFTHGDYLIDKMAAQSAIRNDIYALSKWIRMTQEISEQHLKMIDTILKPLSNKDLDLSESFKAEARMTLSLYGSLETNNQFYDNLFYQPNATLNEYYNKHIKQQLKIAQLPLEQLLKARSLEKQSPNNSHRSFKFSDLYNFIGKMLNAYSGCACSDYIVRGYDLNNIIKMVDIQLQTKSSENQSLSDLLKQKENVNPYNNKPFDYDEQSKSIKFECLDSFSQCEIIINNPKD